MLHLLCRRHLRFQECAASGTTAQQPYSSPVQLPFNASHPPMPPPTRQHRVRVQVGLVHVAARPALLLRRHQALYGTVRQYDRG